MPVVLGNNLLRLADLNPLIRNTNVVGSQYRDKAFTQAINRHPRGGFIMFWEGTNPVTTGGSGFDYSTLIMRATADSLQGPWRIEPDVALIAARTQPYFEKDELAPASAWWDGPNNRWVLWGHGGNNSGPRQGLVLYSTDGDVGKQWVRDSGNPVLPAGGSGTFDEIMATDIRMQRMSDGSFLGFYRGRAVAGGLQGTIGRITAPAGAPQTITKQGEVIVAGGGGTWNEHGHATGGWYKDAEGRIHMLLAGWNVSDVSSIGYFYSDNDGVTWTQYGSNPILSGTGGAEVDREAGDATTLIDDQDVLFYIYAGDNIVSYPTNPPVRAICAAITPLRVTTPKKTGKFYLPTTGTRTYTEVTGSSLLSNNVGTIVGRFKAFRLTRSSQWRYLYTESPNIFNIEVYWRINGGTGAQQGKLSGWFRTPTGFTTDLESTMPVDDGQWHIFMARRLSGSSADLWVDGQRHDTDATTVNTDATATFKAVGNWHPSSAIGDQPGLCTISDMVTIVGTALTWEQALAIIESRTFPSGVSATIDFPTAGTDNGNVVVVEGAINPPIITQPVDCYVDVGGSASFFIEAKCIGTPSYQWQLNYANVGSNLPNYTLTPITSSHQRNVVTCTVTDSMGVTKSLEARVLLNPPNAYLWDTGLT